MLRASGRPVTGAYLGVRTGSRAAPIATLSGVVLFVAAFALLTGPNYQVVPGVRSTECVVSLCTPYHALRTTGYTL